MKPGEQNQEQAQAHAVALLREELLEIVRKIIGETASPSPDSGKKHLENIRGMARHLETLLGEHLTEERIRIADTVQPLWVPDRPAEEEGEETPPLPVDPLAGSIVVVDDDPALSGPLVHQLRKDGYDCVEFRDGEEALRHIASHPCLMVLLDVVMPGFSGREILERIKSTESLSDIPVIMTAQRHELDHIAGSIHEGAEDFLAKPYNPTIVRARVASSIHRKQLRELEQRTFQALVKSQNQLARELSEAAEYVTSLLPQRLTFPVATDWRYIPSSQLGGDSFGYHWIDADHLAIYLLDVCGHGVGAALLSVSVLNFMRSGALPGPEARNPTLVMERLNSTFQMERHNDMFFTVWYGVFNARSQRIDFCSGGHPPAVLVPRDAPPSILSTGGTVIGAVDQTPFPSASIAVTPGSRLYVFSDGVYEIGKPDGEMMTYEAFSLLLAGSDPSGTLDSVLGSIREYHGSDIFDDDVSLLEFRFSGKAPRSTSAFTVRNRIEELTRMIQFTESFSAEHGLSREDAVDLDVILEEIVTNILKYGGLPAGEEACTIDLTLEGSQLTARVSDLGKPFDPLVMPEVDTGQPIESRPIGGLGIHFVKKLTDSQHYEYRDGRNVLTLVKMLRS